MIQKVIISITSLILCSLSFLTPCRGQDTFDEKHVQVALRMIGHRLLLSAGDSTTHFKIKPKSPNQYLISFDSALAISPDRLVEVVNEELKDSSLANGYIVEAIPCNSSEADYSFQMDNRTHNVIIPCQTRSLPESCYHLLFTFSKPLTTTKINTSNQDKSNAFAFESWHVVILILIILSVLSLILLRGRNVSKANQKRIKLGKFLFDPRSTMLIIEEQRTELTGKEADLLLILHESVNELVKKEVLLNKVWGDEGDYIGRTLDVFISKLRKKFEPDPNVRILNVRGVGYKLVIEG